MQYKIISITLFVISLVLAMSFYGLKVNEDKHMDATIANNNGSCFVDGVCLYETRAWIWYIIGWVVSAFLMAFSIYSYFFDKSQKHFMEYQKKVSSSLEEAQKTVTENDKFKAFVSAFTEDEQKVLSAIKEQDGIMQSTIRYKTGLSKTSLSIMLKKFEEKGLIHREISGKSNKVYLKKKY